MFCKKCGCELRDGAKFCDKCGSTTEDSYVPDGEPAAMSAAPPIKKSRKKVFIIALRAMFVVVIAISLAFGETTSVSDDGSFVQTNRDFELAFNMTVEEFISRYNSSVDNFIEEGFVNTDTNKEPYKTQLRTAGVYLSPELLEKGEENVYGEDVYTHYIFDEQQQTITSLGLSVYNGNVTSIIVNVYTANELSTMYGASIMVPCVLMTIDPNHSATFNDALQNAQNWLDDTVRRESSGEAKPLDYFEDNICYCIGAIDSGLMYMIRPMSDAGYDFWRSQGSNNSEDVSDNDSTDSTNETLETIQDMSLFDYLGVSSYDLFRAIGATNWKILNTSSDIITASVSGNGMYFELTVDLNQQRYYVSGIDVGDGNLQTGQACDALCNSILGSAYKAARDGYYG